MSSRGSLNTAYLDAVMRKISLRCINALWKRFELGYIYAHNKIDKLVVWCVR